MLSQPAGLISALSFLTSLFLLISFLDALAEGSKRAEPAAGSVVGAGVAA